MAVIYSSVDIERYDDVKHQGTCVLTGWRASEKPGEIRLYFELDGERKDPDKVKYVERPDVFKICRTLNKKDTWVGFKASLYNLNDLLTRYQVFRLKARQGEEEHLIWEKQAEEIKAEYGRQTLMRRIDSVRKRGNSMVIAGWLYDKLGSGTLRAEDEKGKELEAEYKKCSRPDVYKAFNVKDPDQIYGFEVSIPLQALTGNYLVLHFQNPLVDKYTRIDLKKFAYENSPRGRRAELLSWKNRGRNWQMIRKKGLSYFVNYVKDHMEGNPADYEIWRKRHLPSAQELAEQRTHAFSYRPLISIVIPLYNTPIQYLEELMSSIVNQTYGNWELCLADGSTRDEVQQYMESSYRSDPRIRYQRLEENLGIAGNTNAAADMVRGDYVMLCDHDDLLAENALFEMVKALNEDPSIDVIYTDEDLVNADTTEFTDPRCKPDFNLDFLRSINYICHIFMVRKSILDETGYLREEYDGAQDYDLILRCCEKTDKIHHIPKILYHWRAHENSTAGNQDSKTYAIEAGKKALEEHYRRMGIQAEVEYTDIFIMFRTIMKVQGNPKVSIIIPTQDHIQDLEQCITSIEEKSTWKNYEIIVVENNSRKPETFRYYEDLQKKYGNVKVVVWEKEFNYSAINNFGAGFASGDYFVLMNNDIEVITPSWMEQMLGYCQREDVGMVGAKLYYPDNTVQHAGAVIGLGGFAGHVLTHSRRSDVGYFGRLKAIQDISAVTAACLMISRDCFQAVHGLDEKFRVALNDMDLCLKVRELGKLIVFNPWVELYHYESKSRGMEDTPEKYQRFKREVARFREKWAEVLEKGDPYYNPNLTLMYGDCSLRTPYEHFDILDDIAGDKKWHRG